MTAVLAVTHTLCALAAGYLLHEFLRREREKRRMAAMADSVRKSGAQITDCASQLCMTSRASHLLAIKLCPDQAQVLLSEMSDTMRGYEAAPPTISEELATSGRLLASAGRALVAQYGGQRHAPTRPTDPEGCPVCGTHGEHSVNCPAGAVR